MWLDFIFCGEQNLKMGLQNVGELHSLLNVSNLYRRPCIFSFHSSNIQRKDKPRFEKGFSRFVVNEATVAVEGTQKCNILGKFCFYLQVYQVISNPNCSHFI